MNYIKKILVVVGILSIIPMVNCFATSIKTNESFNEDKSIYFLKYEVMQNEPSDFEKNIQSEINLDNKKYVYKRVNKTGGNTEESINISTIKTMLLNTNNIEKIKKIFGENIEYNENDFVGEYLLNTDDIQIKTNYNGYYEKLVEENIQYENLEKNDLSYITKQVIKNGITLDLIKVDWEVQTTKMIGNSEVPDKYIAHCYYAGKQKIDNPLTYTVTASYTGTATKTIQNPFTYEITYELEKSTNKNILPIATGTIILIVSVLFFATKNVTVYNYNNGKWKKVGRTGVIKNTIKLNRFTFLEKTNKYKLVLNKKITKKLKGKLITIKKKDNSLHLLVNSENDTCVIEIRI